MSGALPVRGGAISCHARRSLSSEHCCSEQERRRPEGQRAGDERHRREAKGRQDEAAAVGDTEREQLAERATHWLRPLHRSNGGRADGVAARIKFQTFRLQNKQVGKTQHFVAMVTIAS